MLLQLIEVQQSKVSVLGIFYKLGSRAGVRSRVWLSAKKKIRSSKFFVPFYSPIPFSRDDLHVSVSVSDHRIRDLPASIKSRFRANFGWIGNRDNENEINRAEFFFDDETSDSFFSANLYRMRRKLLPLVCLHWHKKFSWTILSFKN